MEKPTHTRTEHETETEQTNETKRKKKHSVWTTSAYVKSNTVVGDSQHSTGVVLAEIVRANIPVKNGVVHLIHRPLMVVDTTVNQFLEVWL